MVVLRMLLIALLGQWAPYHDCCWWWPNDPAPFVLFDFVKNGNFQRAMIGPVYTGGSTMDVDCDCDVDLYDYSKMTDCALSLWCVKGMQRDARDTKPFDEPSCFQRGWSRKTSDGILPLGGG